MNEGMPTKPMDLTIHEMTTLFPEHDPDATPLWDFKKYDLYVNDIRSAMICQRLFFKNTDKSSACARFFLFLISK